MEENAPSKKLQPIVQRSAADLYCSLDLIALRLDVVSKGEIGSNISHKITMNYTTIPMRSKLFYISRAGSYISLFVYETKSYVFLKNRFCLKFF